MVIVPLAVQAADLPAAKPAANVATPTVPTVQNQPYNWGGFYVGALAGYADSDVKVSDINFEGQPADLPFSVKMTGGQFGGVAGYNAQNGNLVYGLEGDLSYGNVHGSDSTYLNVDGVNFSSETEMKVFGSARMKVGYALDKVLIYGTGGLAFGSVEGTVHDHYYATVVTTQDTLSMFGWALGGGAEFAFNNQFSLKAEYLYYDLGSMSMSMDQVSAGYSGGLNSMTAKTDVTGSIVRVGLNYRF